MGSTAKVIVPQNPKSNNGVSGRHMGGRQGIAQFRNPPIFHAIFLCCTLRSLELYTELHVFNECNEGRSPQMHSIPTNLLERFRTRTRNILAMLPCVYILNSPR